MAPADLVTRCPWWAMCGDHNDPPVSPELSGTPTRIARRLFVVSHECVDRACIGGNARRAWGAAAGGAPVCSMGTGEQMFGHVIDEHPQARAGVTIAGPEQ